MKNIFDKKENIAFAIAFILVILITQTIGTVRVKGDSMLPNFAHGDVVVINKAALKLSKPKRGDIIVCGYNDDKKDFIIKRVIGLPGDEIDIRLDKSKYNVEYDVFLNGEKIEEDYINGTMEQSGDCEYPFVTPENEYFVMGDNRNVSSDSRNNDVGAISRENMIGKVIFRIYPFNKIGFVN